MDRITIAFPKETFTKLIDRSKQKQISIAKSVRELVDIGLRVEEMSNETNDRSESKSSLSSELEIHKSLLKKGITSGQEILYLMRYILTLLPEKEPGSHEEMRDKAKEKAQSFVEGLMEKS